MGNKKSDMRVCNPYFSFPVSHMAFLFKKLNFAPRSGKSDSNEDSLD